MRMFPSGQWNEMPLGSPTFVSREDLLSLWLDLTALLRPTVEGLRVRTDDIGDLRIETERGRPFLRIKLHKGHVGVHALPMYYHPDLLPEALAEQRTGLGTLRFKCAGEMDESSLLTFVARCHAVIGSY